MFGARSYKRRNALLTIPITTIQYMKSLSLMFTRMTVGLLTLAASLVLLAPLGVAAQDANSAAAGGAQAVPQTATVLLTKKFSGPFPQGVTADQFTFNVEGFADPIALNYVTDDEANATIELPVGSYQISENWPAGQNQADWEVQWSGSPSSLCDGENNVNLATITIEERHLDMVNIGCRADNEYTAPIVPEVVGCTDNTANNYNPNATQDDGSCTFDPVVIEGCTDSAATNYDPTANQDDGSCVYPPTQCMAEMPAWAAAVVAADQGDTKGDGAITNPDRIDPNAALSANDWVSGGDTGFFSLGFGGSLVLEFGPDGYVLDEGGDDLTIFEATNDERRNVPYPAETALVAVSQDGSVWYDLGTASNLDDSSTRESSFDIAGTGLQWIRYVRITDTTDAALHTDAADGYDVDAVRAVTNECDTPVPPTGDTSTSTLTIVAAVASGESDWSFDFSGDLGEFALSNGTTSRVFTDLATGTYALAQTIPSGWENPQIICTDADSGAAVDAGALSAVLAAGESVTCTFTNNSDDGGAGDTDDTYEVYGFVWHDENEDGVRATNESPLAGWTITASNGSQSFTAESDAGGRYSFNLPAGTWTISQESRSKWLQVTPTDTTFTVVVPAEEETEEENEDLALGARVLSWFIPTAHAATIASYGPYDFGNSYQGGGGSRSLTEDNDGGSSTGGGTVAGASDSTDDAEPVPQVLGEQVSIVPVGAPNTGAGGAAPAIAALLGLLGVVFVGAVARVATYVR